MKKTINGVKHDFESHISNEVLKKYNKYDYDAEYTQIIDGVKFVGIREFRVSKKSGAYHENFVFQGVKYPSVVQFAKAALSTNERLTTAHIK